MDVWLYTEISTSKLTEFYKLTEFNKKRLAMGMSSFMSVVNKMALSPIYYTNSNLPFP